MTAKRIIGLKANGEVLAAGCGKAEAASMAKWSGIAAVASSDEHSVCLKWDGTVVASCEGHDGSKCNPCGVDGWRQITAIAVECRHTVGLEAMKNGLTGEGGSGSALGDIAGLGVTLGAMGGVIGMTKDAISPVFQSMGADPAPAASGAAAPLPLAAGTAPAERRASRPTSAPTAARKNHLPTPGTAPTAARRTSPAGSARNADRGDPNK